MPKTFGRAVAAAKVLGRDVDYVRCDFLCTGDRVLFGELTTYTSSGHLAYADPALEAKVYGNWDLGRSWFMRTPQRGWRELYRRSMQRVLAGGDAA